jgi:sec-independent protein translocase protein TatA
MTGIALTDLQMALVNATEWIIIIAIIVVVLFGAKKLPELARSFGRATTEYEKAKIEAGQRPRNNNHHLDQCTRQRKT